MINKYDFIAIGDTTVDAFIRLKDAAVNCDLNRENCQICMKFAEKIPYEDVFTVPAVGNSANAAVAAARLGLKTALVSNVGDDYWGKQSLQALRKEKIKLDYLKINKNKKTNYHFVLWFEDERTILIKHQPYVYKFPKISCPKWIYLSSLGESVDHFYESLESFLKKYPQVKLAFQPGNFQIKLGSEKLSGIYQRTEVFICNKEEAERVLRVPRTDVRELLGGIAKLGPKIVVITDGKRGAYAHHEGQMWKMPIYPDIKPPFERTGAGDAFSSTFVAALVLGKSVTDALKWAPVNSMSVVQKIGAQAGLLNRKKLEKYLRLAPTDYKPQKFI